MEGTFKTGDLVKIKTGPREGKFGRIVEMVNERQALYQVEFPYGPATTFFFEDELEKAEGIPCPHCIDEEKKWTQLSEPYWTEEGWAEDCPVHGKLYLWGWFRVEEGQVLDLLTGKSLEL